MDPRLVRALATASALAIVGLGASLSVAQQSAGGDAPANAATPAAAPSAETPAPAAAPAPAAPTPAPPPETAAPPPENDTDSTDAADNAAQANVAAAPLKPPVPVPAARPVRGQVAVLQVLDKVTAETMRFQTPVGGKVRYKSLIIEVKVCETRGADDALPKPSAYLEVTSDPRANVSNDLIVRKEVFKGWMFANTPGVHALQHPTYDLWLITCGASAAPAAGK